MYSEDKERHKAKTKGKVKKVNIMTTIYKVSYKAFDFWFASDRSGFQTVEKFFSTKEKAENYAKEAEEKKYIFRGYEKEQTVATEDYQEPYGFEITEITVE
jgi:hypothetical protein